METSHNNKQYKTNKEFIKKILIIALPIILGQLLSTSFGLIDTIMVKTINRGISSVGLASQVSNILGTIMFAFATGVGMFISQFFGNNEKDNTAKAFSLLLYLALFLSLLFTVVALFFPRQLLLLFTQEEDVLEMGIRYIQIAAFSYIPNMLAYSFSVAYRNVHNTIVPFIIQLISATFNVLFNWLLIFGIWIFPEMGIEGAALATVISCCLSLAANLVYFFIKHPLFFPKMSSFIKCFDKEFIKAIFQKTFPLLINETLFSIGTALYIVIFNKLGPDSYEGYRITETIVSLMFSISLGFTAAVATIIGASLGRGNIKETKEYGAKFLKMGVGLALVVAFLIVILANPLVNIFKSDQVTENTINIATSLMYVSALRVALRMFTGILFSVFRAGGRSRFVMIMDCGVMWVIGIPIALICYYLFHVESIAILVLCMQLESVVRIGVGLHEYFKYTWQRNIINNLKEETEVNDDKATCN